MRAGTPAPRLIRDNWVNTWSNGAVRRSGLWLVVLVLCVTVGFVACSGDGSRSSSGSSQSSGQAGAGGAGGGLFGTGGALSNTLVLDPPSATILVDNGVSMPLQFRALFKDEEVNPQSWQVDFGTIADVNASGLLTPSNTRGGQVQVTAEYNGIIGTATVAIMFKQTLNPEMIDGPTQDLLRGATGQDAAITWAYPYDGTVWPQGLKGPELMWNGSASGDLYYAHFQGDYIDLEVFTSAEPPSRYQIQDSEWIAISQSNLTGSGNMTMDVARLPAGAMSAAWVAQHNWKVSRGSLEGTVYYWANNLGRIVRIQPGQDLPDDFLFAAGVTGCTACHTVSANGQTLVIGGDDPTSTYDLLNDVTSLRLGDVGKAVRNWAMPAISPDGVWLVENNAALPGPPGGADGIWETHTGTKLTGTQLDGVLLDMPAFGPKGHKLAYIDHTTHDLGVYEFNLATGEATMPQTLITMGTDPNLNGICFPSVSPTITDGEGEPKTYIVYHRGQYPASYDTRSGPGELYMSSADEPNMEWRLSNMTGDNYPFAAGARDLAYNYEPTFAPQAAGGYMWVVFTSRRTYGNRLTGDKNSVKQLWVAAIDPFPVQGSDPSHPAFWLHGQDPGTLNMRGYWALDPCIPKGDDCVTDSDCCDGALCEDGVCGGPDTCSDIGEFCEGNADCCEPEAECIAQECRLATPN